ncbi:MAG: HupE/UreJ family protein [Planctomycetota bacterium]
MSSVKARRGSFLLMTLAFVCASAPPTSAHLVQTGFGTFYDGLAHFLITPTDVLAVLALGALAGLRGASVARPLLFVLSAAWLAGGIAGAVRPGGGELPLASALSVALLGALVAANARPPRALVLALGGAAGLLHGYANGVTLTSFDPLRLTGAVVACFVFFTLAAGLVVGLRARWQEVAVRVAGSWIAAIGVLMIGWLARDAR